MDGRRPSWRLGVPAIKSGDRRVRRSIPRFAEKRSEKKDGMGQKLMTIEWLRVFSLGVKNVKGRGQWFVARGMAACLLAVPLVAMVEAQAVSTTTVQGTVYLANGQSGAGTLVLSWPAFTTAAGQAVAADSTTLTIGPDGFVSVNLAPNVGATPAGEYYTAVFYMSDGSTSTEYWVVPAAAQATLAQVQARVMPAAQAVQAVTKAYVDQSVAELTESLLTASGGNLSGPLYLSSDPTQPLQASDKHYVDAQVGTAVPLGGGNMTGALTTPAVNGVQSPATTGTQTTLQAAMNAAGANGAMVIPPSYAGTDTFTNPNGVRVTDLRTAGAQQAERSVKEFGTVCDGATDDTNALQAALNYANAHGVALTIPQGTCKTRTLNWHGESIGGMGKQVSALMGFPGEDVLASGPDAMNMLSSTRLHDLTIYVDQSVDASCAPAQGRAAAGSCQMSRRMETNSIFSPGGNGLTGTAGVGAGWWVGNCAIAMQASTGMGGNGLRMAEIENVEVASAGTDAMAAQYPGAHSTHTCGMYLAQWPQWSKFRNIDVRGVNTGIAIPALPVTAPAGLNADSNRWQNVTVQATHAFTAAAGSNNVLDNVVAMAGNSAAAGEPPTGLVLDLGGNAQGWTVRNAVVMPGWNAVQPQFTVTAAGGAVTSVVAGTEHGLGWDPYGTSVPVAFSGSCSAQAIAAVNADGSIGSVTVTQGGAGCSSTTTASVSAPGTWDTAAPVNLVGGQDMTFFAGNLLKGSGGYTVWNAASSASYGTQLDSGGGMLPGGGSYSAITGNGHLGTVYQVDQFPGADLGAKTQACVNAVNGTYGGTCDARNFTGNQQMGSNLTLATGNVAVLLPCATITTANEILVTAGTRNVSLRGCALRGGTAATGSQGGTVFAYSGTGAMFAVGDPSYGADTPGFHLDNVVINTTSATSATAQALAAYRTQELDLESLYLLGNSNQTAITLDGTGNYTGGTFLDDEISGFGTAVNAVGHQIANPATTDWMNASAFVRLHIDCPTNSGSPISGTYGINLQQGDGNTFTGGDVEGCSTALHLGANAQNNTIVGLRNENSTNQVVADAGSAYNNWITGGTVFTGKLIDNGTRNSFLDTFHRSFNGLNGDWYGSQQDATVTNHFRLGTGNGNERGLLNRYQTDSGYRWTAGLSDATGGEQFYQVLDELNNVYRLSIGQYNNGQASTNNQTVINAAGTGGVVLNGSNNSGTGGVIFGSGGPSETTVATISNGGNAQFNGTLQVGGTSQSTGTMTVRNSVDAEVDYYLWPGLTTSQKGSFTYKDWNGNSQWLMVKDASNNWALNSASGGLDSFKAYQSTNSGDTYVDSSNSTGHIRLNYESGSGAETDIYSGSSANLDAAFLGPTSIKFPGLAASSGHSCMQIDSSGYLTNTGTACGTGSGGSNGTINSGSSGQIAYYTASGTSIGGMSAVPLGAGGTGATTAANALANLGGQQTIPVTAYGAVGDCTPNGSNANCTDNTSAIQSAINAAYAVGGSVFLPFNPAATGSTVYYVASSLNSKGVSITGPPGAGIQLINGWPKVIIRGAAGKDVLAVGDPTSGGYINPSSAFRWADFGIIVDDSTDVSATINGGHRKPGKTCTDVVVTNGSPTITSSECEFTAGDVGQAITVTDGTNTLATTISSVAWNPGYYNSPGQSATLAANWTYSSGSNRTVYLSLMGLPTTASVGNCAFAMDNTTAASENVPLRARFENLSLLTTSLAAKNNSCGFFFQANQPYADTFDNISLEDPEWGVVFALADNPGSNTNTSLGDTNNFININFQDTYPWVSYDGLINTWKGGQIAGINAGSGSFGPQILAYNGANTGWGEADPSGWKIDSVEFEQEGAAGGMGWRVEGNGHHIFGVGLGTGLGTTPAQWDAWASTCEQCGAAGTVNLAGILNDFSFSNGTGFSMPSITVNDTGFGNFCRIGWSIPPFGNQQGALWHACSGVNSRQNLAFAHNSDFVRNGNETTPYNNQDDLWIWPQDINGNNSLTPRSNILADPTSESGAYVKIDANVYLQSLQGTPSSITIGPSNTGANLPATFVHVCVKAKADSGSGTGYFQFLVSGGTDVGMISAALTTAYSTSCEDVKLVSYAGQTAGIFVIPSGITVDLAWISMRPWPNYENVNGPVNATAFQVSGSPFGTVNLSDWTNAGLANGNVPIWNGTANKWTPGAVNARK